MPVHPDSLSPLGPVPTSPLGPGSAREAHPYADPTPAPYQCLWVQRMATKLTPSFSMEAWEGGERRY